MLFDNYRIMKRLGKHFVKKSVLFSAPVLLAGACGLIGLAALIYLKRRADGESEKSFAGFKEVRRSHRGQSRGSGQRSAAKRTEYSEDDFIVIDAEEGDVREADTGSCETKEKTAGTAQAKSKNEDTQGVWIASSTSKTFHRPDCSRVERILQTNRTEIEGSKDSLIRKGYKPCASCIGK